VSPRWRELEAVRRGTTRSMGRHGAPAARMGRRDARVARVAALCKCTPLSKIVTVQGEM
jgi:hypothetical protein